MTRCWHESAGSSQIVSYTWAERRSPQFGLVIAGFKGPPACCPHPIRVGCKKSWNLWRFKLPSGSNAPVAQGIEHRFPKAGVAGSNPAGGSPTTQARGGSQRQEEKPSASRRLWRVWFCAVRNPTAPSGRLPAILQSLFALLFTSPKKRTLMFMRARTPAHHVFAFKGDRSAASPSWLAKASEREPKAGKKSDSA